MAAVRHSARIRDATVSKAELQAEYSLSPVDSSNKSAPKPKKSNAKGTKAAPVDLDTSTDDLAKPDEIPNEQRANSKAPAQTEAEVEIEAALAVTPASGRKRSWTEWVEKAKATPRSPRDNYLEPSPGAKKRKVKTPPPKKPKEIWPSRPDPGNKPGDKRPKQWLYEPIDGFEAVHGRAMEQRMFILDRIRGGTEDHPTETLSVAGTTGNIYTIFIDQKPTCNCPHIKAQCKHIAYVMDRVYRMPKYLMYQMGFLKSELVEIFNKAPPIVRVAASETEEHPNRKPITEGTECPICYCDMEPQQETVFCKDSCGNNLHKECFNKWFATMGRKTTCPYCRAPWPAENADKPSMGGYTGGVIRREGVAQIGYVNIASQLGLSGKRDKYINQKEWDKREEEAGNSSQGPGYGM